MVREQKRVDWTEGEGGVKVSRWVDLWLRLTKERGPGRGDARVVKRSEISS